MIIPFLSSLCHLICQTINANVWILYASVRDRVSRIGFEFGTQPTYIWAVDDHIFIFYCLLTYANFYRPQRNWGKVIFSEVCVKNSVGGACVVGGMRGVGGGACVAYGQ